MFDKKINAQRKTNVPNDTTDVVKARFGMKFIDEPEKKKDTIIDSESEDDDRGEEVRNVNDSIFATHAH